MVPTVLGWVSLPVGRRESRRELRTVQESVREAMEWALALASGRPSETRMGRESVLGWASEARAAQP